MHKEYCIERERIAERERAEAKKERHDFRAEVALTLDRNRQATEAGFAKIDDSVRRIHGRINAGLVALVMALLGIIGALFWKVQGW